MILIVSNTSFNVATSVEYDKPLFNPDERLSSYINSFNESDVDHSGLRSLIQPLAVSGLTINLTINITNSLNKAKLIHDFIRANVKYEPRLESLSAEQVLLDGRGDCSEMSILAQSMIESLGFQSYITNGNGHAFVVALIDSYWIIIDPTQDFEVQTNWFNNIPDHAYLINSTATLSSYSSTISFA